MTTGCAAPLVPSAKRTVRDEPVLSSATTERAVTSSAPNLTACRRARSASWAPVTPSGKPREVSIPLLCPARPPGGCFSPPAPPPPPPAGGAFPNHPRPHPLGGPAPRPPQPRRSAPDDDQVVEV